MTDAPSTADRLKVFIEFIEEGERNRKEIAGDIEDAFAEAEADGFNAAVLRRIIALRAISADETGEEKAILDQYLQALGMET